MDITTFLSFALLSLVNSVSPGPSGVLEGTRDKIQLPVFSQNLQKQQTDYHNVTITHRSPNSVEVSWNCRGQSLHDEYDKYEVMLKPLEASYKVVETVPYNICYLLMDKLEPNTNYKVSVTSISGRNRKRFNSVVFRTYMEDDYTEITEEDDDDDKTEDKRPGNKDRLRLPRVRLVEISLVGMALILWAGAIVLFFHRWGKIRMLLPYQPDYKEMKRTNSVCANCSMTPHHQCCRLHQLPYAGDCAAGGSLPGHSTSGMNNKPDAVSASVGCVPVTDTGCSPIRPRLNTFVVYDVNDCRKEYPLGVGRKTKSAEQLEHYSPFLSEDCMADAGACTEF